MNEDFYKKTDLNISTDRKKRDLIRIQFLKGCCVSINGDENKEYSLVFFEDNKIIYKTNIKSNHWSKILKQYFGNYKVDVFCEDKLIKSESLNLLNKSVLINIQSSSLGDSLAWIPQIDKFQKLHNCIVYVKCNWKELFEKSYPNLNFYDAHRECYASYDIGYFKEWKDLAPSDPRLTPLPKIASDILGMSYEEIKPKLLSEPSVSNKKYVCIAIQSTSQCKYWNNKTGWDEVVKYLNNLGYEVWCIDKHKIFGKPPVFNKIPAGAIDKTGDFPLVERMKQITGAEFFIGLSSGLAWLAWACGKPVVMVSGFTDVFNEFSNPLRVINKNVCNSCWNDSSHRFDPSNWLWCPRNKNFECSKEITFEMVKEKIDLCIDDLKKNKQKNFNWGDQDDFFKQTVNKEIFETKIYEKFFKVDKDDIVVDLGSSVGPFIYSILDNQPKKCYVVEPLTNNIKTLKLNINSPIVEIIQGAITDKKEVEITWNNVTENVSGFTFDEFLQKNNITKINFLKSDCEGGEYDVFQEKNVSFLKTIPKIVAEFHLTNNSDLHKQKFRNFRDKILPLFNDFEVYSVDGIDIKWNLQNEYFLEYYAQVLFYFRN